MTEPFEVQKFDFLDKNIEVYGPQDLHLFVDYDDVEQDLVEAALEKMIRILNEHWND